jgi:hypothetical protein
VSSNRNQASGMKWRISQGQTVIYETGNSEIKCPPLSLFICPINSNLLGAVGLSVCSTHVFVTRFLSSHGLQVN